MGTKFQSDTISNFIGDVNSSIYVPYIQRDFVWDTEDIIKLFDSILSDYPIGSFLIWRTDNKNAGPAVYTFPKDYITSYHHPFVDERYSRRPKKMNQLNLDKFELVLDGQQRITSIYLSLKGSIIDKKPRKSYDDKDNWERKQLYLNLNSTPERNPDTDTRYDMEFKKTEGNSDIVVDNNGFWYRMGCLISDSKREQKRTIKSKSEDSSNFNWSNLRKIFANAYSQLNDKPIINYYRYDKSDNIGEMLEMFIRTNEGGTKLGKDDIAMSILTEYWRKIDGNSLPAREQIESFLEEFNESFNGLKDVRQKFLIKNLLYCSGNSMSLSIGKFDTETIKEVHEVWLDKDYKESFYEAYEFIDSVDLSISQAAGRFGLHALIYYFYETELDFTRNSYLGNQSQQNLVKFLTKSKIKNLSEGGHAARLNKVRDKIDESDSGVFPIGKIEKELQDKETNLNISEEYAEELVSNIGYEDKSVFPILLLAYSENLSYIKSADNIQIDHIYPRKEQFSNIDSLSNLELLTKEENEDKKRDMGADEWIKSRTDEYIKINMIPQMDEYKDEHFETFISQRQSYLVDKIKDN